MTSSTMAGERRWGSARRGGMTVLGKVAVPKPLNLPSQRLENHGLDPNVEIVPKGTLNWGSRSSSSATNAWGSSSLSPSADSSANSPSHLSGRPSSGGSGTRPSTAGSDRPPIEPTGNAWHPNSRPSSASGALASNESLLTSLRPRSAETRPASSQLSRFAEPVSDSPGAWGASGTTERLGVVSSKKDGFSLSSGDFPTLGSDKDHPGKSTESKDPGSHARPSSASGRVTQTKDKTVTSHADDTSGAVNTWRKDGSQNVGDEVQPSMEKWQGEPQQYFNPNVPPQHFDAWRGPMNAPAGVWYRGPPGGPPYGAPIGPGGFPIEPFPYFRPQIPPPAFANSQPVPPPRGGLRGHHPKSGNAYRPQIPDAFVRPGMPFRPGFFPAPMAFEGYYGPPMGYCNSNERDIPFMGIGAGPSVYDRCTAPNTPDPGDSRARASGTGPSGKTISDDVESVHSSDARGPYKVLIKQHNEWDGKEQGENREHKPLANASHPVKGEKAGVTTRKYEWGAEDDGEEDIYSSDNFDNRGGYVSDTVQAKSSQSSGSMKPADDCWIKNSESVTSSSSQMRQVSTANGRDSALPSTIKGATLIQKIEGLNAKVRAGDGRVDYPSSGKDQMSGPNNVNAKVVTSTNKAGKSAVLLEGTSASGYVAPTSHGVVVSAGDRMSQPTAAMSRRPYHGMSSGIDHRGKGKFSNQDADGWQRKPVAAEFPIVVSASKVESACDFRERDAHQAVAGINPPAKDEGESVAELHDSTDSQAQRAKMRELAKQRAIQLQKEEEERIREQKAKALAKLEEFNRRMQSGDASNQTTKTPLPSGTSQKEQEGRDVEPRESATKIEAFTLVAPLKTEVVAPMDENSGNQVAGSAIPSKALPVETSKTMKLESVPRDDSVPLKENVVNASAAGGKSSPQLSEGGGLKLKRTSYKQKQNTTLQKNLNEKSIPVDASDAQKSPVALSVNDAASNVVASSEVSSSNQPYLPNNSSVVLESSAPQRRRSNKSIKYKNKQDDAPPLPDLTATAPSEAIPPKTSNENVKSQASTLDLNTGSIQAAVNGESGVELLDQRPSLPSEEAHGRVNQWKSQHSRRMPRNQQANRFVDKIHGNDAVMWAPVRSQNKAENKAEATVEGVQKPIAESVTPAKCDNLVQNSSKSKRAEMERYVPKPVAKELAQQVGMQKPDSSSVNISTPDETASQQPVSSATGNIGSSLQSREGVGKHNKQGKVHGAWRQRGSTEFSDAKNVQQGSSSTSDPSKNFQEVILKHQPLNLEANSAQAETKTSSELNSNNWIASSNSDASAPDTSPVSKDLGVTGKGNRHPYRGHRNMGNSRNNDNKDVSSAETDRTHIQTPASDINQSDRDIASKETRDTGERISSHWQPKSHANSVSSQRGSRITGSQNVVVEASTVTKKNYPRQQRAKTPPQHYEENNESGTQLDQCLSENKVVVEMPKAGNQEPRRERKLTSSKGRPYSPNQNPVAADESGPAVSADTQHERPFSAGSRRHGNQISRSVRGHQSPRDWSVQESWQQNIPTNRDRQRHNMHYEYQPVGSYNNTKSNNFEGLADGSRNAGPRYRERGQSYPKRGGGNFHGRQSGHLPVDAGCD